MLLYALMTLYAFVGFLIVSMILLQESKGGGIAAMGGAAMDGVMGARNPLRRMTAYGSIIFVLLALGINTYIARSSKAENELQAVPAAAPKPALPPATDLKTAPLPPPPATGKAESTTAPAGGDSQAQPPTTAPPPAAAPAQPAATAGNDTGKKAPKPPATTPAPGKQQETDK